MPYSDTTCFTAHSMVERRLEHTASLLFAATLVCTGLIEGVNAETTEFANADDNTTRPQTEHSRDVAHERLSSAIQISYRISEHTRIEAQAHQLPSYDWSQQTVIALQLADKANLPEHGAVIEAALKAFGSTFAGWRHLGQPGELQALPSAAGRSDLFVPNLASLYASEFYVEEAVSEGAPVPRSAALQLPMLGSLSLLWSTSWQQKGAVEELPSAPNKSNAPEQCSDEDDLDNHFLTQPYQNGGAEKGPPTSLLIIRAGCIIDWEGGQKIPIRAEQLLIYDHAGQLSLSAGFGQVTLFNWTLSEPPLIFSALIASAFNNTIVSLTSPPQSTEK